MNMRFFSFFSVFIFVFALVSCKQAPMESVAESSTKAPAAEKKSETILLGLRNKMQSGLQVLHPAIMFIEHGRVLAYRAGTQDAGDALVAIRSGEMVEDAEDRQQETQAAFDKLLNAENIALESIAGADEKVILLFSPDKSLGECPPCDEVFGSLEVGEVVGGFTVKKVAIENR